MKINFFNWLNILQDKLDKLDTVINKLDDSGDANEILRSIDAFDNILREIRIVDQVYLRTSDSNCNCEGDDTELVIDLNAKELTLVCKINNEDCELHNPLLLAAGIETDLNIKQIMATGHSYICPRDSSCGCKDEAIELMAHALGIA